MGDIAANYYDDLVLWQTQENVDPGAPASAGTAFDIGDFQTCAVKADKIVWCWGMNYEGQLGDGTLINRSTAVQVVGLTDVAQIGSNGGAHSCAVKTDSTVWCWGMGDFGALGDGTTSDHSTPIQVPGMTNVRQVDTGDFHSCAVKTDGTAWCWGANNDGAGTGGQLGDGTTTNSPTPVQVAGGFTNVKQISTGYLHTCAVKNDGTAWCWGSNQPTGQLGDGTTTDRYSPVQVLTNVIEIKAGDFHSCALKNDGTVWCWGKYGWPSWDPGYIGYLGDGLMIDRYTPGPVSGLTNVAHIDADDFHSCALKTDGTVWCWGSNLYGQLGDGTTTSRLTPIQVVGLTNAVSIHVGETSSCAGKSDGTIWCWGANTDMFGNQGMLGNGSTINSSVPVQVLNFP